MQEIQRRLKKIEKDLQEKLDFEDLKDPRSSNIKKKVGLSIINALLALGGRTRIILTV